MSMQIKKDESGNPIFDGDKPVYVWPDGKEAAVDVDKLFSDLSATRNEAAGRRKDVESLSEKFKAFDGIEPEAARKALETVSLLDAGKLVEAGKMEEFKAQVEQGWKVKLEDKDKAHAKNIEELTQALSGKDAAIRHLVVRSAFDSSSFLREKTTLPPDMAYAAFGKHFEVKEENGEIKAVASIDGQPIFSRANPGTFANPEEAIEALIEKYPYKERILRDTLPGGSGASKSQYSGGLPKKFVDCKTTEEKAAWLKNEKNLK